MDDKNPHRVVTPWCEVSYWGRAKSDPGFVVSCGINDNPISATIRTNGHSSYPSFDFELPRQRHELHKIELMMRRAYEKGKVDNRRELGEVLKALIAI